MGGACDRDDYGSTFFISSEPPCPSCGSQTTVSWESMNPTEVQNVELVSLTHANWFSFSADEQMKLLSYTLEKI